MRSRIPSVKYDGRSASARALDNALDARHGILLMMLSTVISLTILKWLVF